MTYYITAEVVVTVAEATPNLNNTAIITFNTSSENISEDEENRFIKEALALIETKQINVSGVLVTKENIKSVETKNITISTHNFIDGKSPVEIIYTIS